jgi:hypothetical protein
MRSSGHSLAMRITKDDDFEAALRQIVDQMNGNGTDSRRPWPSK